MSGRALRVGVAGATGAVGEELLRLLAKREIPIASLRLLASARSAGTTLRFAGEDLPVEELRDDTLRALAGRGMLHRPDVLRAETERLLNDARSRRFVEAFLVGAHINPYSFSWEGGHEPDADRKLLLHRGELDRLIGAVERKGYALVPLDLHWRKGRVKLEVGLARGKKQHDKRAASKDRDWARQKERILKR